MFDQEAVDSADFHWTAQAGRPFMPAAMPWVGIESNFLPNPTRLRRPARKRPPLYWATTFSQNGRAGKSTPLVTCEVIRENSAQVR